MTREERRRVTRKHAKGPVIKTRREAQAETLS